LLKTSKWGFHSTSEYYNEGQALNTILQSRDRWLQLILAKTKKTEKIETSLKQQLAGLLTPNLLLISITEVSTLNSIQVANDDGLEKRFGC